MLFSLDITKSVKLFLFTVLFLLMFIFVSCSSSTKSTASNNSTEYKIAKYEYGQDRTILMEFAEQVNSSVYSEKKRNALEEKLIKLLSGNATFASKEFACRQLRIIGSEKSLPVLSELIINEKTNDIARYALENIHGKLVDETLIKLLGSTSKNIQLGIINTLGTRKSEYAVSSLAKLLNNYDSDISIASAYALGKIANKESAQHLDLFSMKAKGQLKNVIWDSYLSCGDELVAHKKNDDANDIYTKLYSKDISEHLKKAALVGIINTSQNQTKEIKERILNEPEEMKSVAISKLKEIIQDNEMSEFAELFPSLSSVNQIQMLSVLEDIYDRKSKPYILNTLNSDVKEVRIASIKALANIGDDSDVLAIAEIAAHKNGDEADYARSTLSLLKGDKIDQTIIENMTGVDDDIKVELIKIVGTRSIQSAFNSIVGFTKSKDSKIRAEAYKSLSEISTDKNLIDLTNILLNPTHKTDRKKAERTISRVILKNPNSKNNESILNKLKTTNGIENRCSLLRLIGNTNISEALKILTAELQNDDKQIKLASVIGLSSWSTPQPLNDLINVVRNTDDPKIRSAALKGFTSFIDLDKSLSNEEKVGLYKKSLEFTQTGNERNVALDGIGHIDSFESLETLKPYINQPDVKETVDDAINRVSWHLYKENPERVKQYVQWFLSKINDERFQTKNNELLNVIDRYVANANSK